MYWYLKVLKQYADFSGRARRKEYWMFFLFNLIFTAVLSVLDILITLAVGAGFLYILYALAVFIPSLAVLVRRLHDTGKSGWWIFITLIPLIGWIWLFVLLCADSDADNEYGKNPKQNY
jgi:uncharacterized membrane protein YhaH (DUF805 family)